VIQAPKPKLQIVCCELTYYESAATQSRCFRTGQVACRASTTGAFEIGRAVARSSGQSWSLRDWVQSSRPLTKMRVTCLRVRPARDYQRVIHPPFELAERQEAPAQRQPVDTDIAPARAQSDKDLVAARELIAHC
jgi:hypothetical protein